MKTIYIFSVLAVVATLASCKKYLDVQPRESVSDAQTIFDKTSAEEAVRGIYNAVADDGYYGTSFQSIGYLSGDNVQWTGSQSQVQEFINHDVSPDNTTISAAWTAIFAAINRANQVIGKVPQVQDPLLTDAYRGQLIGEAYFIRALAYLDLARTWGGVPIITQPTLTATDNFGIGRSTQQQTFAQALSDLNAAEPLLPLTINRFRVSRQTVWALKARYYLYTKDWANAETFATNVLSDASNYQLVSPYGAFFLGNAKGTQESVFEIYYNGGTEVNAHGGQWLPQTLGGTRQWAPTDNLVALVNDSATGGNRNVLVAQDNQNRWYGNLYPSINASSSFVIRIAEIYLIRAEAEAQQNHLTESLDDLNEIRARADLAPSVAASQDDILLAIENERRIEFAFEPHRWFDLVRTGRAPAVLNVTDANRYLMPIPSQQILLDHSLTQNAGY